MVSRDDSDSDKSTMEGERWRFLKPMIRLALGGTVESWHGNLLIQELMQKLLRWLDIADEIIPDDLLNEQQKRDSVHQRSFAAVQLPLEVLREPPFHYGGKLTDSMAIIKHLTKLALLCQLDLNEEPRLIFICDSLEIAVRDFIKADGEERLVYWIQYQLQNWEYLEMNDVSDLEDLSIIYVLLCHLSRDMPLKFEQFLELDVSDRAHILADILNSQRRDEFDFLGEDLHDPENQVLIVALLFHIFEGGDLPWSFDELLNEEMKQILDRVHDLEAINRDQQALIAEQQRTIDSLSAENQQTVDLCQRYSTYQQELFENADVYKLSAFNSKGKRASFEILTPQLNQSIGTFEMEPAGSSYLQRAITNLIMQNNRNIQSIQLLSAKIKELQYVNETIGDRVRVYSERMIESDKRDRTRSFRDFFFG